MITDNGPLKQAQYHHRLFENQHESKVEIAGMLVWLGSSLELQVDDMLSVGHILKEYSLLEVYFPYIKYQHTDLSRMHEMYRRTSILI